MRDVVQHIPDVEIPIIEISDGWAAEDCNTTEQCNDAFAYLMSAVAGIEYQIDMELTKPKERQDLVWMAKAKCALKFKKTALQIINQKRSVISSEADREFKDRRDRKLLEYIRSVVPGETFLNWIRASGISNDMKDAA